ncbi:zf-TFIIB domain-containing protein [Vitiosangium sp. GDMCC 1.1324]|uniref:TFIIB-type zinc ribbon-containing protein n=1 Tax=Vitiosangium sp. (strain GDMCC 1.1324) TaxID=2138576 RepID=UPI001E625263|nr:zf-TFIIB domain-containing protein [Vitiosangium sp. GDMCC 1.1324]
MTRQAGDFLAPFIARVAGQIIANTEEGRCPRGAHTLTPGQEQCEVCPKPKLRCPACTSRLVPLEVHEQTVDVCTRCPGLWLDANELAALRSAQPQPPPERPSAQGAITFYPSEDSQKSWGTSVGEAVGGSIVEVAVYLLLEALFSLF